MVAVATDPHQPPQQNQADQSQPPHPQQQPDHSSQNPDVVIIDGQNSLTPHLKLKKFSL